MRALVLVGLMSLVGCPGPSNPDGGAGGGSTAGGSAAGGTGTAGGATAGGGGGGGGSGGGMAPFDAGTVPLDQVCNGYLDATCELWTRCGFTSEKSSCLTLFNERFNPWFQASCLVDEQRQVDAGRLVYDGRSAAACLHALRVTGPCSNNLNQYAPECDTILRGAVAAGGGCTRSNECVSGNYCDATPGMCPGRCLSRKPAGADAGLDEECQGGYYAYEGRCRLYALTGLSCAPVGASMVPQQCLPNVAYCNTVNLACTAFGGDGGVCMGDNQCAFPLRCNDMRCGPGSGPGEVCGYGFLGAPGQACKIDLACSNGLMAGGGVCRALGVLGQSCFNQFECVGPLQCPGVYFGPGPDGGLQIDAGTCQAALTAGGACTAADDRCDVETTFCRVDAGTCAGRVASMGACSVPQQCTPPDTCVAGTCRRPFCVQ